MDYLSNNHSYIQSRQFPPSSFRDHPLSFSSSQLANVSRHGSFIDEELKKGPDIVENIQMLLGAGLDLGTVLRLRQNNYRNALNMLADAEDDDLYTAFKFMNFAQPQPLPQHIRARLSQQSYTYPQSRVPSLISDRSSLRLSGNLGTPVHDDPTSGLGYASDISPMSSQWPLPDERFRAPVGCDQDTTMDYLATGEEHQQVCAPDLQNTEDVTAYSQLQQAKRGVPPAIPGANDLPLLASVVDGTVAPSGGDGGLSFMATMIRPPFVAEQDSLRDRNRMQKSRFPCPVEDCRKDFTSPKEFAEHLIGDHDKDSTFSCMHPSCNLQSHRLRTYKRHHSSNHSECQMTEECIQVDRRRVKKHWACGLCLNLDVDVQDFANHYKSHFEDDDVQKSDIRSSNIIRSLLMQDATKAKWEELGFDLPFPGGHYLLSWDGKDIAEIREALEYETFRNLSLDNPYVVDDLLDEVFKCGTRR
ncbi:uncharacterized protein Z520_09858 [Fonsecaea multimorphosa CBS 102226]|uniref:C2H2-type domain-containing protein n=1 Tax=Fonsecaea multimorphosa CBS 102226 TaxID=1442371 RepID=A0A0D2JME5_9EURO|nr:uncharacterized protein Z520_09858 [Fonsecaea multimorphosa CBS 102226]KIX94472.1 hypothetical protein Z520_09858 [Fonsecaea multimorphosa CBS 102226]OAL20051.1 hypothetical protein AYO22_09201 [Fonsecaea multimorphosa]